MRSLGLVSFGLVILSLLAYGTAGSDTSVGNPRGRVAATPAPRMCTMVGCSSGVSIVAHLDASPAELVASGTVTACHQGACGSGVIKPPRPYNSPDIYECKSNPRTPLPLALGPCLVEPEGSGSLMTMLLASEEARAQGRFTNGDRVSLRVKVGDKTVLDVVRYVEYEDNYPNGVGCGGYCRNATFELWPSSPTGKTCGSGECEPYVRFEKTVPMTEDDEGGTTVTACRNGQCETGHLELWRWKQGRPLSLYAVGAGFGPGDRFSPTLDFRPAEGDSYRFVVTFRGDTRLFKRGDRFSVDWRGPTGRILMKSEQTVADYDESYPGGRSCTPVACRQKTFHP